MYLHELIASLRAEAAIFDERFLAEKLDLLNLETAQGRELSKMQVLAKYNLETMLELKRRDTFPENVPVDGAKAADLRAAIDAYMDRYAAGQERQKLYTGVISVYLCFAAGKPLHPAGFFDPEGRAVYRDGLAYCPLKAEEIGKEGSLCRFCVSAG